MDRKNVYMGSIGEVGISFGHTVDMDKAKRFSRTDGIHIHHRNRLYNSKMGEITVKILNWVGFTGMIYAFIANLSNSLSIVIGIGSAIFLIFKILKMREDWLFRKAERKRHELENMEKEDNYIRRRL